MLSPSSVAQDRLRETSLADLGTSPDQMIRDSSFRSEGQKEYASDHSELHSAGFTDHVLVPRRIPDELDISLVHAVDR
jgi:hypothetical protein